MPGPELCRNQKFDAASQKNILFFEKKFVCLFLEIKAPKKMVCFFT
jgi:hypothetical protein